MTFPVELRTARLLLRPWRAADAAALLPVLESNQEHLGSWIPKRVSEPAPISVLEQRLAAFGANFAADREWRFALFTLEGATLGEVGLFPRSVAGRVPLVDADRVEVGYWLRVDYTRRGLIAEAARAVLAVAATMQQFSHAEIRCDGRNASSVSVAARLGFVLADAASGVLRFDTDAARWMQLWTSRLEPFDLREDVEGCGSGRA